MLKGIVQSSGSRDIPGSHPYWPDQGEVVWRVFVCRGNTNEMHQSLRVKLQALFAFAGSAEMTLTKQQTPAMMKP